MYTNHLERSEIKFPEKIKSFHCHGKGGNLVVSSASVLLKSDTIKAGTKQIASCESMERNRHNLSIDLWIRCVGNLDVIR